jgi:hypothetical protein
MVMTVESSSVVSWSIHEVFFLNYKTRLSMWKRCAKKTEAESKEKHGVWDGPYAGVGYNIALCPLQSRLQHSYHGQPYARVDLKPMPEST